MIRMSWLGALTRLGVAAAVMLGAAQALAAPVVTVEISSDAAGYAGYLQHGRRVRPIRTEPSGWPGSSTGAVYGTPFNCDWSIVVNPDPQITSTFTLTNITAVTQNFVMTVTLPIAALGPGTVQGGYFGDLVNGTQYTDTSGNSDVTLATVGANPFYSALVNGILSQGLGSFTLNANGGPGVFGNESQQTWGDPIPSAVFGPASGNIQIRWRFSLTAGDQVSTKGFFQVEQAPEPTTVVLDGSRPRSDRVVFAAAPSPQTQLIRSCASALNARGRSRFRRGSRRPARERRAEQEADELLHPLVLLARVRVVAARPGGRRSDR